jgi:glyoxylase-like metal-dependent hydrolase (beta-lactamase superfamily II)
MDHLRVSGILTEYAPQNKEKPVISPEMGQNSHLLLPRAAPYCGTERPQFPSKEDNMFESGRMKTTAGLALSLLFLVAALRLPAQDFESIPIVRHELSKDISLYQIGRTGVFSNMTAVRTSEGVVVFDSLMFPELAKRVRALIEKDFGSKIACLINTHGAPDHTGGNVIFEDVPIYGHQNIKTEFERMTPPADRPRPSPDEMKKLMDQMKERKAKEVEEARKGYLGDIRVKEYEENDLIREVAMRSFDPAKPPQLPLIPTTLIGDRYTLRLGGKTFEMSHNTPSYSDSDIITWIPEEKALVIGDIFNAGRLPGLSPETDLESWEKLFSGYISNDTTVEHFICTHGAGTITAAEIREQFSYLKKLVEEVRNLKASGKTAAEIQSLIPLAQFPYLKTYNPYFYASSFNLHNLNIDSLWKQIK